MEHEGNLDKICNRFAHNGSQRHGKWSGWVGIRKTSWNHPNYGVAKIGQNTEKSSGDLRWLAVTQAPVKDHQLTLIWKTKKKKVQWYINLCRLFNAKAILLEEQQWYYVTHSWEDKGVHTFPKSICPKVNVIARVDFELPHNNSAVHRFNHYTTRTPKEEEEEEEEQ